MGGAGGLRLVSIIAVFSPVFDLSSIRALLFTPLLLLMSIPAYGDTYLPLDSRLYDDLRFLEAEGVITTSQLATLPISRAEGGRLTMEASTGSADRSPRVLAAVDRLRREFERELEDPRSYYLSPVDAAEARYLYSDSTGFFIRKNRDGVAVRSGNNLTANLTSRFESRNIGAVVRPEVDLYEEDAELWFREAYLMASIGREEFMLGKESAWWGPAMNGATLLSNNIEPLTMLKVSNSVPYFPFGVGVRGTLFLSRLEGDRADVRRPILNGVRLDIKPAPWVEFGLTKTALFGGEGRDEGPSAFVDSLFIVGENSASENEPGDQRAGFDVKLVLPWRYQPVTLYLDAAGEDQRNRFPCKWFWLFGFYLPHVLGLEGLDIMAEYGDNNDPYYRGTWYTHHIYSQGYTYKGRIIGHYIGSDAKDLFLRARYDLDKVRVTLSYEQLQKVYPQKYDWENYQGAVLAALSGRTDLELAMAHAREAGTNTVMQVGLRHRFD